MTPTAVTSAAAETLPLVRDSVKRVLTQSAAFRSLDPDRRRQLAHDMVKVARYMVDGGGQTAGTPMKAVVSTGLAGSPPPPNRVQDVQGITRGATDAQKGFDAAAAKQGSKSYTEMIRDVDFPAFVAGLIDGVFNAIVTSSIKQMEAYGTLVANVAKSVDEYMRDNVTENQARDYLAGKYPEHLEVDTKSGQPQLKAKGDRRRGRGGRGGRGARGPLSQGLAAGGMELPDFMKDLGLPDPVTRLDDKTAEEQLVPAARRRMAMDRQELLATMVLMGINRLIVTDGKISANCLFELDTLDTVFQETTAAADFDEHTVERQRTSNWGFWFIPSTVTRKRTSSNFKMSTTNDRSSESNVEMHAKLGGNVDINFRSETFPLEKMADILQIREIEAKAPAAAPAPPPGAPAFNLPPPPPLPSLPGAPGAPAPATPAPGG